MVTDEQLQTEAGEVNEHEPWAVEPEVGQLWRKIDPEDKCNVWPYAQNKVICHPYIADDFTSDDVNKTPIEKILRAGDIILITKKMQATRERSCEGKRMLNIEVLYGEMIGVLIWMTDYGWHVHFERKA